MAKLVLEFKSSLGRKKKPPELLQPVKWGRDGWLPKPPPIYTPMIEKIGPWVWAMIVALLVIWWISKW